MIQIFRSADGPNRLKANGAIQTAKDCADYDASPKAYRSGKKKFASKRGIYASKDVKAALSKAQHNKCCYCEKRFRSAIFLAVEHYRPKTGVRQSRSLKNECPGYYWLAYEWSNLLLSCHECNSSWKQILFPLMNPAKRARSHHQKVSVERPYLIDPLTENPRDHIQFRGDAPHARTVRGRITIGVLGLRRPALREDRFEKLEVLKRFLELTELASQMPKNRRLRNLAAEAQTFLDAAVLPDAEFSSMAQDFFSGSAA